MTRRHAMGLALLAGLAAVGCAGSEARILIDPDGFGSDQGTLISIGDVRVVAEDMIRSMNESRGLARLRTETRPLRILVGDIKQRTSITIFDKEIFSNQLLGRLSEADVDGFYSFIRRESVLEEGRLQEEGAVERTESLGELLGASHVLSGEIREILHREPLPEGGELEKRTIQYTLGIDSVRDGARVWLHTYEIVKEQVTGAVYS